jgi:hypothetical protein
MLKIENKENENELNNEKIHSIAKLNNFSVNEDNITYQNNQYEIFQFKKKKS